ncbi:hypothetical protein MSS93_14910 [Deinococcus radiodurans]|nr:hypothetical protein MSS93_14910 [Deinococcus radiodurans]
MTNDDKTKQANGQPETAATENMPQEVPAETQEQQPGSEAEMSLAPVVIRDDYRGSDKLKARWPSSAAATAASGARWPCILPARGPTWRSCTSTSTRTRGTP